MDMSTIGEAVLIAREGRRLTAYRDSVGIWTIGVGHTAAAGPPVVTPGLRLTEAACDALFRRDLARYVRSVAAAVPADLPDHAFDALVPRRGAEYDQFRTPYAQALPRARRGDAAPIPAPSPPVSSLPAPRRSVPRVRVPVPAALASSPLAPLPASETPPAPGVWARLWSALRAGAGRTG
jgi:lysozyme